MSSRFWLHPWLLGALLCIACGAEEPRTRSALDAARLDYARKLSAETRAPELWRELEAARALAKKADDEAARADHMALARLWLEASIVECERADVAAQRLAIEREIETKSMAALHDERRAAKLVEDHARQAAAALARDEAARALERVATLPARRPKLDKQAEADAARALLARATIVTESARALGAKESAVNEASALADRARGALPARPDQALDFADRALSQALVALGPLRAAQREVSAGDKRALVDDLEVLGAKVTRSDQGLLARIEGPAFERVSSGSRTLARLCAVALAHPHGAVRMLVTGPSAQKSAGQTASLKSALTQLGCGGERFSVASGEAASAALDLHFLAY